MFDITKEDLKDLLRHIHGGEIQLPEFQRSYVWDDADVRSLIASVAKGYPVGALLMLQSGGQVKFKPRLLEGVPAKETEPSDLLLDGQQRMTSLYQATFSQSPVRTRNDKKALVDRYYYIDINAAVTPHSDIAEAIVAVSADKTVREDFGRKIVRDLRSSELEYSQHLFPLNQVFDPKEWLYGWRDYWKAKDRDVFDLEKAFDLNVIDRIQRYKMPIIKLDRTNSREAICLVFEKVNVGGKKLDAFELVTAIYAAHDFDLRQDWSGSDKSGKGRLHRIIGAPNRRDVLTELASTDFLQSCTLVSTHLLRVEKSKQGITGKELPAVSCNREALLSLPLDAYCKHANAVEAGFVEAAAFLNEQKIIWHRDIPYPPQVVGLAAVAAILGEKQMTKAAKEKLELWFWSGVLGELYGSSTESRLARDLPELIAWITNDGPPPRTVGEAIFQKERLYTIRSRLSAAYRGIHALLMRSGCQDFISGKPTDIMTFFNDKIDIHHIFPQQWCQSNGIAPGSFNSIVNKTPLSKLSNILIGGDAPSVYLERIENSQGLSPDKMDAILRSHLINPMHLRNNDFEAFFKDRMEQIAGLIETAMGKPVVQPEAGHLVVNDPMDAEETAENEALESEAA